MRLIFLSIILILSSCGIPQLYELERPTAVEDYHVSFKVNLNYTEESDKSFLLFAKYTMSENSPSFDNKDEIEGDPVDGLKRKGFKLVKLYEKNDNDKYIEYPPSFSGESQQITIKYFGYIADEIHSVRVKLNGDDSEANGDKFPYYLSFSDTHIIGDLNEKDKYLADVKSFGIKVDQAEAQGKVFIELAIIATGVNVSGSVPVKTYSDYLHLGFFELKI